MLSQLLKQIRSYLDGDGNLNDLETWLVTNLVDILDADNEAARKIANNLDADIIFLKEDLLTEKEFRSRLKGYLDSIYNPVIIEKEKRLSTGCSNSVYSGGPYFITPFVARLEKVEQHAHI